MKISTARERERERRYINTYLIEKLPYASLIPSTFALKILVSSSFDYHYRLHKSLSSCQKKGETKERRDFSPSFICLPPCFVDATM